MELININNMKKLILIFAVSALVTTTKAQDIAILKNDDTLKVKIVKNDLIAYEREYEHFSVEHQHR